MLVVSNILQDEKGFKVLSSEEFLRQTVKEPVINIQPDYRYMKLGYYVSMHAEAQGTRVIPTCIDVLDAYNNALLLARSEKKGIPIPPHLETNNIDEIVGKLDFPLIIFPLNPFSYDIHRIVNTEEELFRSVKSLGMNFRYPVSAQSLMGRIHAVKSVLGSAQPREMSSVVRECYEEFRIPLCKLYIQREGENCYLCSMSPLKLGDLKPSDLQTIKEKIKDTGREI